MQELFKLNYVGLSIYLKKEMNKIISIINEEVNNFNESEYRKWKRDNVTARGINNIYDSDNSGMAKYGQGLYSVPLSNIKMAKGYGKLYYLVNAKPKHPKIVNNTNEAEIFLQKVVTDYCEKHGVPRNNSYFSNNTTIADEMIKLGFDGLIIKGREMVNYTPDEDKIRYYENENQLIQYYEMFEI